MSANPSSTSPIDKSSNNEPEFKQPVPNLHPIENHEVELLSSDSEEDDEPVPPLQNPELDPNYEFANLLLGEIRRLTPEMRELARAHIHRILRQYWQADLYDPAMPRPTRSVPRKSKKA